MQEWLAGKLSRQGHLRIYPLDILLALVLVGVNRCGTPWGAPAVPLSQFPKGCRCLVACNVDRAPAVAPHLTCAPASDPSRFAGHRRSSCALLPSCGPRG